MSPLDNSTEEAFFGLHMEFEILKFDGCLRYGRLRLSAKDGLFWVPLRLFRGTVNRVDADVRGWFKRELRLCKQNPCVIFKLVSPGTTADSSRRGSIVF